MPFISTKSHYLLCLENCVWCPTFEGLCLKAPTSFTFHTQYKLEQFSIPLKLKVSPHKHCSFQIAVDQGKTNLIHPHKGDI